MMFFQRSAKQVSLLPLLLISQSCVLLQPITEPTERILRRASCISFDIPPITLTSEQTAIERQLLGEEVQIEPKGSLLSSSQSTSHISRSIAKEEGKTSLETKSTKLSSYLLRRYYVERAILKYYEKTLRYYRSEQILGEGFDGRIRLVPFALSRGRREEERDLARKLASEVNRSRVWLHKYHLRQEKEQRSLAETQKKYKEYLASYFEEAKEQSGEWIYTAKGKWSRIP